MSLNPFSLTSGSPYHYFRPFVRQRVSTFITEDADFLDVLLDVLRMHCTDHATRNIRPLTLSHRLLRTRHAIAP